MIPLESPNQSMDLGLGAEEYQAHVQWLRQLARGLVHDPAAAEDVAQETWLSALRFWDRRGTRPLRPWLAHIAKNNARKAHRSEGRRRHHEELAAGDVPVLSPAELAEAADLAHTLMGEVRELGEPYRSTVLQRYMQGLSAAEIARRDRVPQGTVRWRLSAARDELRERMDRRTGSRQAWAALAVPAVRVDGASALGAQGASAGLPASSSFLLVAVAGLVIAAVGWATWSTAGDGERLAEPVEVPGPALAAEAPQPTVQVRDTRTGRAALAPTNEDSSAARPSEPTWEWTPDAGESVVWVRVQDNAGEPIPGATILWPRDRDAFGTSGADGVAGLLFRPPSDGARLGFRIERSGYVDAFIEGHATAGSSTDLGTVTLRPAARVAGRVLGADGAPIAGARVGVAPAAPDASTNPASTRARPETWPGLRPPEVATDANGTFSLAGVPRQPLRVWAVANGTRYALSETLTPAANLGPLELHLEPLGEADAITGRLRLPDGIDLDRLDSGGFDFDGALLQLRSPDGRRVLAEAEPSPDGRFRLLVRGDGPFQLMATDLLDRFEDTTEVVHRGARRVELRPKRWSDD